MGGGVEEVEYSTIGWMRRLHRDAGGEIGVPTVDIGGD